MKLTGCLNEKKVFVIGKEKTTEEQLVEMKKAYADQSQELTALKATVQKHEADLADLKASKTTLK